MTLPRHIPVLLEHVLAGVLTEQSCVYADCTAGLGGHAAAVAARMNGRDGATVALNDLDAANLKLAERAVSDACGDGVRVLTSNANFVAFPRFLLESGVQADAVLADLGFSSSQMDAPERGLSIKADGPLDMRFDPRTPLTAGEIVNTYHERELADIIKRFGEEPAARRIASAIVARRAGAPLTSTKDLASCITGVLGRPAKGSIHPATRTFQALRIAVNDELASLDALLESIARSALANRNNPRNAWLAPGARIAIISFHSLEDRRVKVAFRAWSDRGLGVVKTKTPLVADEQERAENPRSRSAKLRIFELQGSPGVSP